MRKTKYRRGQESLKQSVNKYKAGATNEVKQQPYIIMSQKGFWDGGSYEDTFEVAAQVIISMFRREGANQEKIITQPITVNMMIEKFNVLGQRPARVKKKFEKAMTSLEKKGLIKTRLIQAKSKSQYFTVEQLNVEVNGVDEGMKFFQMETDVVNQIILFAESDNDRENLLAMYASLVSQMNNGEVKSTTTPDVGSLKQLMNHLSLASAETLGIRVGIKSKSTAANYINELADMKAIFKMKVHKQSDEGYKWSQYYSKYSERAYLIRFVEILLLNTEFMNNEGTEFKDYRWVNIDDVWDEEIHNKPDEVETETDTQVEEVATQDTTVAFLNNVIDIKTQQRVTVIDSDEMVPMYQSDSDMYEDADSAFN